MIDDEESRWDTSQHKNKYEGKRCPAPDNHEMAIKKQNRRLLTNAEDFKKDLKFLREEHQSREKLRIVSALWREGALCQGL